MLKVRLGPHNDLQHINVLLCIVCENIIAALCFYLCTGPPGSTGVCSVVTLGLNGASNCRPTLDALDSPGMRRRSRHAAKLKMGDPKDDIHVCIMCLRAIMNNKVRNEVVPCIYDP